MSAPVVWRRSNRLFRALAAICAAAGTLVAPLTAADSGEAAPANAPERGGGDDEPRINVIVPLSTETAPLPHRESTASYRRDVDSTAGAWRWREPRETQIVVRDLATRLIVHLERDVPPDADGAAGGTAPDDAPALVQAGEEIAALFSVRVAPPDQPAAPAVAPSRRYSAGGRADETSAPPSRVPPQGAGSAAAPVLGDWRAALDRAQAAAAGILAGAARASGASHLRLSAFVVRERAEFELAPTENAGAGGWTPGALRVLRARRTPLVSRVFAARTVAFADTQDPGASAAGVCAALGGWLIAHYGGEAVAGATAPVAGEIWIEPGAQPPAAVD